jgi:hypothetical protein
LDDRPKELWVKTLDARAWRWLRAKQLPEHLLGYEKKTPPACVVATDAMRSLFERFDQIADWREPIGKRHRLSTVMAIVALACLSGAGQGASVGQSFCQTAGLLRPSSFDTVFANHGGASACRQVATSASVVHRNELTHYYQKNSAETGWRIEP